MSGRWRRGFPGRGQEACKRGDCETALREVASAGRTGLSQATGDIPEHGGLGCDGTGAETLYPVDRMVVDAQSDPIAAARLSGQDSRQRSCAHVNSTLLLSKRLGAVLRLHVIAWAAS